MNVSEYIALLHRKGSFSLTAEEIPGDIEEFRKALRKAARAAGTRIQTILSRDRILWVINPDHQVTEIEMRAVAMTMGNLLTDPESHVSFEEALEIVRREQIRAVD